MSGASPLHSAVYHRALATRQTCMPHCLSKRVCSLNPFVYKFMFETMLSDLQSPGSLHLFGLNPMCILETS